MTDVYRFIKAGKTTSGVALLCRLLKVARSSYAWAEGEAARRRRQEADGALAHKITVLHVVSKHTYGAPRIHAGLVRLGRQVNHKRVERIMWERGITGVTRRRRRSLTRSTQRAVSAPDLIGRVFTAPVPGGKLGGDITFIPTEQGWLYLATRLDLATREVVGYAMADHHRASLVVDALTMAAGRGDLQPGCIAHSDRGSEYTSEELRCHIKGLGLRQSKGRTGSCHDNTAAESFFAVPKEEIGNRLWPDRGTARAAIFTYIETFYNRRRLRKPTCGTTSPRSRSDSDTSKVIPWQRKKRVSKAMGEL
ncbi:IS3 family transposase [Streptomyces sp. MA15]|uniref:IS3 family transposase n=1 Tax=Streptomyces sp. MA15 TaxID=3055061 RepID=UPI0025B18885|nr:IS3 family transposase [Streptomyces sp. MA15]MDN3267026.1 IS3 family transposase [Streptomyces sp. MA15]